MRSPRGVSSARTTTLTCSSPLGKATDTYNVQLNGSELEIGVNSQLLCDALRATETDEIYIKFHH